MKKILLSTFIIINIIACKETPKVDYAIVSGKITNKTAGDVSIQSEDRSFTKTLDIADDGTFTDTLTVNGNTYVLYDGKNPVFMHLEPSFNINVSYDATDFKNSIAITGKGSEINNYLLSKRKKQNELFGSAKDTYSLNEADYKEKLNTIKASQLKLLDNSKNIPTDYKEREKRNINYFYLSRLNDYEGGHEHFSKQKGFTVSDEFLNELKGIDYTNVEDFEFSRDYKNLVTSNFKQKANALAKTDSLKKYQAFFKTVRAIDNEVIKNELLLDFAKFNLNYSNDKEKFFNSFLEVSTNEENNTEITKIYNKLQALNEGKPSPQFVNYENNKGGNTSLSDLKGKYVYIDVWATWCGPCIGEIPALKKVEKQFHNENIEFVSISIDKKREHDKWKTMIKEKELGGIQLFADNNWNSKFVQDYQINGIPRFILIDPEGNIVDANAPRPSSPKLVELFTKLSI